MDDGSGATTTSAEANRFRKHTPYFVAAVLGSILVILVYLLVAWNALPYVPEEDSTDGRSTLARPPVHDIPFHPSYFDGSLLLVENMSNAAAVRSVDDEWIAPLRNGMFAAVEWYSHGFSPKYRAVMETGHVVAVRFLPALVGVHAVV